MLTLWRRHRSTCPHKADRYYRKSRCAMWCEGTVEGVYRRESLKTRSWERDNARGGHADFFSDLVAQNRAADTVRKYRLLFSRLADLGAKRPIEDLTSDILVKFRSGWKEKGAATRNKKLDRLKAFFSFRHDAGWITMNPTKAIKPAATRAAVVKPFTQAGQDFLVAQPPGFAKRDKHKCAMPLRDRRIGAATKVFAHRRRIALALPPQNSALIIEGSTLGG